LVFLDGKDLVCQIAQPYFRFLQGFLGLLAVGDIGQGETAPLPALDIPPTVSLISRIFGEGLINTGRYLAILPPSLIFHLILIRGDRHGLSIYFSDNFRQLTYRFVNIYQLGRGFFRCPELLAPILIILEAVKCRGAAFDFSKLSRP
jgi:hypothetical protein